MQPTYEHQRIPYVSLRKDYTIRKYETLTKEEADTLSYLLHNTEPRHSPLMSSEDLSSLLSQLLTGSPPNE